MKNYISGSIFIDLSLHLQDKNLLSHGLLSFNTLLNSIDHYFTWDIYLSVTKRVLFIMSSCVWVHMGYPDQVLLLRLSYVHKM